jgi:hypothetical protein
MVRSEQLRLITSRVLKRTHRAAGDTEGKAERSGGRRETVLDKWILLLFAGVLIVGEWIWTIIHGGGFGDSSMAAGAEVTGARRLGDNVRTNLANLL